MKFSPIATPLTRYAIIWLRLLGLILSWPVKPEKVIGIRQEESEQYAWGNGGGEERQ